VDVRSARGAEAFDDASGYPAGIGLNCVARDLVDGAVKAVGADEGVLLLRTAGRWDVTASSSGSIGWIELMQHNLGHGPGVCAVRERRTVFSADIHEDERWPEWAQLVARRGIRSVMASCLHTPRHVLGTLSVFAQNRALDRGHIGTAGALADRAEVLKVEITFELDGTPGAIIEETLTAWHRRRLDRRPA
jgi:hypothetical protein